MTVAKKDKVAEKRKSMSMHDDVQVWDDCCSCEAEPYWIEAMDDADVDRDTADKDRKNAT